MTIEEFLMHNPSREVIARQICIEANEAIMPINETYAWKWLSEAGQFKKDDFYDDTEQTRRLMGDEAVDVHGIYTWKLKDGVL
ncbi:hypothetical protein 0305phi8-36p098 [Bacillus phage 0305phi8-36]|uniref:hypothetical protein n=1 Tax=Bacillus phage 0305phi8-36 TaxID=458639 RepID=UPI00015A1FC1|nr:hypothetical protein ST0305phi8-36p098 [Bacillus phage 0305phi8-36]ABS83658.1 hypothetical protein 0305phi8-36p098 [Bacillus phage 0305phi8-36]